MGTASRRTGLAGVIVTLILVAGDYRGVPSAEAQAAERVDIVVDFEHLPDGNPTTLGPIGDDYAEWGIHFSSIEIDPCESPKYSTASGGGLYAWAGRSSPGIGYNIVTDFDMPVWAVSAHVTSAAGETVEMVVKDVNGVVLDSVVSPPVAQAYGFVGPVELTCDTAIASVEWRSSSATATVGVDDLRIVVDEVSSPGTGKTDGPGYLAASWNFNEGEGSIAHDFSRHGNDATLCGPVSWTDGHEGKALNFAGVDNYLLVEDSPELNAAGAITVAAWVDPMWTGNNRILQKGSNDNQYRLLKENGDNLVFDLSGVTNGRLEHNRLPVPGEWTHVAATYNGSAMRLYYNATLVAAHPAGGLINTSMDPLCIGSKRAGAPSGDEYRGLMDDLCIYNRALTAGMINTLFEWSADCQLRVTNVKIVRGESVEGRFQPVEEVNNVTVGDLFQVRVEVTNMGAASETVFNLYGWTLAGEGQAQVVGRPCVGIYPINLDPGESALLDAFCPASQAFQARAVGSVDMDISVSPDCRDTFSFEITEVSPPPCQLEVTDVRILRGQFLAGRFQELEQLDKVTLGDSFQVVVEVTNVGTTTETVLNLYGWTLSGQGDARVIGQPCVGLYPIDLDPGESTLLDAFCPGSQAFQATRAGWVTIDISLTETCSDTFSFEILPVETEACQPEITSVQILGRPLVGSSFQDAGQVDDVSVGDYFTVHVTVTNQGDDAVEIFAFYGWDFSGQGSVQMVGDPFCIGLPAPKQLQPGESETVRPHFCSSNAFQATAAGWVTMDIGVGDCHDSFTFQILPAP